MWQRVQISGPQGGLELGVYLGLWEPSKEEKQEDLPCLRFQTPPMTELSRSPGFNPVLTPDPLYNETWQGDGAGEKMVVASFQEFHLWRLHPRDLAKP